MQSRAGGTKFAGSFEVRGPEVPELEALDTERAAQSGGGDPSLVTAWAYQHRDFAYGQRAGVRPTVLVPRLLADAAVAIDLFTATRSPTSSDQQSPQRWRRQGTARRHGTAATKVRVP